MNTYRRHLPPAFNPTVEPYYPWMEIPAALLIPLSYFLWLFGVLQ